MFTKAPAISPGFLLPLCASEIHVSMVANQELPGHPVKMQAWLIRPPQHSQTQGVDRQSPTHCLLTAKVRNQSPSEISRPPLRREKKQNPKHIRVWTLLPPQLYSPSSTTAPTELWGPKSHEATRSQEWLLPEPWQTDIQCSGAAMPQSEATDNKANRNALENPWFSRAPLHHLWHQASKGT